MLLVRLLYLYGEVHGDAVSSMRICEMCGMQFYSLQLERYQTWQTWPYDENLLQFLDGGRGQDVVDMMIAALIYDIDLELATVKADVDTAHMALKESVANLQSSLLAYNSSTIVSDSFV